MPVEKKNIFLKGTGTPLPYKSSGYGSKTIPSRDPVQHINYLKQRFTDVYAQNANLKTQQVVAIRYKEGVYLEFSGKENHDLIIKSLENVRNGIRLLNVRIDTEDNKTKATVYVPDGKESYFINRLEMYLATSIETQGEKIRYKDLINSIENVKLAFLDSFWFGNKNDIPRDIPVWCEIWLRVDDERYDEIESLFGGLCKDLNIPCDNKSIRFPERMVKLIRTNKSQLGELIMRFEYLAEIRRAAEVTSFFDELPAQDQKKWMEELLSRVEYDFSNTSVCILDTGVNTGHPLLSKAVDDECIQSVESAWGENDHNGHGTEVAGVALYFDLKERLLSTQQHRITHHLESVKILPPVGENDPKLYGAITQNAVYMAESTRPHHERAICMAVTSDKYNTNDGSPTSWSGAVDSLISGAADSLISGAIDDNEKRLFFVSAGNVYPHELTKISYPDANVNHLVESPGQAWNAITVGAYSNDIQISDTALKDYQAVADHDELSPYSSTSMLYEKKWPIKPEILCDGGNVATDGTNYTECSDLSLLTTYHKPLTRLFNTTFGTSSATAQAAWMAAQIMAEYPGIWPETVRALLIHSARWTDKMKAQFCNPDSKSIGRRNLLRACGYGIPNLKRAMECLNNNVNLVIESELQPFTRGSMNEMHVHKIPWPREVLQELGVTPAVMRVTLSYFIEPSPGEIGWKDKYRYPSCGLRFDVINKDEKREDFIKRINIKMRGEDLKDKGEGTSGSDDWYIGTKNRDVGSVHSDFREQNAVDLCEANYIAVFPVVGWWRERTHLKHYNRKVRYSLIVSISTPETKINLYTPIITQIETLTKIPVEIKVK
ncbi:MAG: S8 family peptidase [Ruminiclostridium sp.]|nr:S8 family peptidase [Ruminiclostridium sp.]